MSASERVAVAIEAKPVPDFCQLTEDRRFTHNEFDTRLEVGPKNLRLDVEQNELRAEFCPKS